MHAAFVRVEIDARRGDEAVELLHSFTIPAASGMPGFVAGTWARADDGTHGEGVILFDSADHARGLVERASQGPPPGAPVTFLSGEVFEVLARA